MQTALTAVTTTKKYNLIMKTAPIHNRPAAANGRSYRGQSTGLVAAALFFRKINCGFRYAFQLGAFFWPSCAPGRGGDWKRILIGVKFD